MDFNVYHKQTKGIKFGGARILDSLYCESNNLISITQNIMAPILY